MTINDTGIGKQRDFPDTVWGLIAEAQEGDPALRARCLGRLIELYWKPVYCVVRRYAGSGDGDVHQDAKDLTQDFFATVILDRDLVSTYDRKRGSFRTLLRTALSRFMNDVARGRGREKRGAQRELLALDVIRAEFLPTVADSGPLTPEQLFDAAWNEALLADAFKRLEERLARDGRSKVFEIFRRYDVDGDSQDLSYAALGTQMGLSAAQVRHALEAARREFREIVTELLRRHADDPEELATELRSLLGA